jgi:hypothetical protein
MFIYECIWLLKKKKVMYDKNGLRRWCIYYIGLAISTYVHASVWGVISDMKRDSNIWIGLFNESNIITLPFVQKNKIQYSSKAIRNWFEHKRKMIDFERGGIGNLQGTIFNQIEDLMKLFPYQIVCCIMVTHDSYTTNNSELEPNSNPLPLKRKTTSTNKAYLLHLCLKHINQYRI